MFEFHIEAAFLTIAVFISVSLFIMCMAIALEGERLRPWQRLLALVVAVLIAATFVGVTVPLLQTAQASLL